MEQPPNHERSPHESYVEAVQFFEGQLKFFESRIEQRFETPADAIYGFAQFIRNESEQVLAWVRKLVSEGKNEHDGYRLEQAAAKLHEFNCANADLLHRYAELLGNHPEAIPELVERYPWLNGIAAWADDYMERTIGTK